MTGQLARPVGINHVALEVGDLEAALDFYGSIFAVEHVEREPGMAFIEMGDQFIALSQRDGAALDADRHFGLVVDDQEAVRAALAAAAVALPPGGRLEFRDPWGNRFQVVGYRDIRFSKAPGVLRGMGLEQLGKSPAADRELADAGLL